MDHTNVYNTIQNQKLLNNSVIPTNTSTINNAETVSDSFTDSYDHSSEHTSENTSENSEYSDSEDELTNARSVTIQKPRSTIDYMFVVLLLLVLGLHSLAVVYVNNTVNNRNNTINITTANRNNITITNHNTPIINWWNTYVRHCCLARRFERTVREQRMNSDYCLAHNNCRYYLSKWLQTYNQTFANSSSTEQCCYEYRTVGSKEYNTYCSFTCLNTFRVFN